MKTEELYNKLINLKIKDENGDQKEYLNEEEKNAINKSRKTVKLLNMFSKLFVFLTIICLIIIFILAGTSGDDFKIPTLLGFGFFISLIMAPFCYILFLICNSNFKNSLNYYFYKNNNEQNELNNNNNLNDVLYALSSRLSENNPEIMQNIINCINDPKTYYLIHKNEIEKHNVNTYDNNSILICGVINILDNYKKVSIIPENSNAIEFINNIQRLDNKVDLSSIKLSNKNFPNNATNIANCISDINIFLEQFDKVLMLFDLSKVYNDEIIVFNINKNELNDFSVVPGMVYVNVNEIGGKNE